MKSFLVMVCIAAAFAGNPLRAWTTREGRSFDAALSAVDGLRATLTPPDKPPMVVPLTNLVLADVAVIRAWRADWRKPLIVPTCLAPWPDHALAPAGEVRSGSIQLAPVHVTPA